MSHTDYENYIGHSEDELARLERQAAYFRTQSRNLLICAGITTGMRVADFGSGAGDLAILVSELVGESGEVIAVDRSHSAMEKTKHRMAARGIKNVTTLVGDENRLAEVFHANKLDAVVGRFLLMHQKDVSASFCKLVESIRPGGIVAFQDMDFGRDIWAEPALPLMSKMWGWLAQISMTIGMPHDLGNQLNRAFDQAGIQARYIALEGSIETGPDSLSYSAYVEFMRGAVTVMQKINIGMPEEVQVETLAGRLRDEAVACQAVFIPFYLVNAYGRTPA